MLEESVYIAYHGRECFFVFLLYFMIIFPLHTFLLYIYIYIGLIKFDTTREHDTNPIRFLRVCVEYNRIWVIFMLTRLTRLINGSYLC